MTAHASVYVNSVPTMLGLMILLKTERVIDVGFQGERGISKIDHYIIYNRHNLFFLVKPSAVTIH